MLEGDPYCHICYGKGYVINKRIIFTILNVFHLVSEKKEVCSTCNGTGNAKIDLSWLN